MKFYPILTKTIIFLPQKLTNSYFFSSSMYTVDNFTNIYVNLRMS